MNARLLLAAVSIAGAAVLASCVTEHPKPRTGISYAPPPEPVKLPPGPIATPVPPGTTTNSSVQVALVSMGTFRYDGQVLPLVSPDGRLIAVESGEPPTWPTFLADAASQPPNDTHLAVYDISQASRAPNNPAKRVEWPGRPIPGLMLGRSADARGFLVEWPRPDGARWIGRMPWLGGSVEWLAQNDEVNAHGVLTSQGWLVYTRREKLSKSTTLVLRSADGTEDVRAAEAGSFAFPIAGSDPDMVYVLRLADGAMHMDAIHLVIEEGRPPRFGTSFAQALVAPAPADPALAYQITAPVQGPLPMPAHPDGQPVATSQTPDDPPLLYHPGMARMAIFDPRTGSFVPLAPRSINAVRWDASGSRGYLCTTPEGLVYCPVPKLPGDTAERAGPQHEVRILPTPYVARVTVDPERPVILFSPGGRDPGMLEASVMRPAAPVEPGH